MKPIIKKQIYLDSQKNIIANVYVFGLLVWQKNIALESVRYIGLNPL